MKKREKPLRIEVENDYLQSYVHEDEFKAEIVNANILKDGAIEFYLSDIEFVHYNYAFGDFPYPQGEISKPKEIKKLVKRFNKSFYHFTLRLHFKDTRPIKAIEIYRRNKNCSISRHHE